MNRGIISVLAGLGLAIAVLAAVPIVARADEPPPPTNDTCTVDKQEQPGTDCNSCVDSDACLAQYDGTSFTFVCRSDVTSKEVWCDGPARDAGGCASMPANRLTLVAALGLILGSGLLIRRLRRRP